MYRLVIEDDEGRTTLVPLIRDEFSIGRREGNSIRLTQRNVSRKHARVFREETGFFVEDLGSYNGVRLNGERIAGRRTLREGDIVQIGDYHLMIQRVVGQKSANDVPGEARDPAITTLPASGPIRAFQKTDPLHKIPGVGDEPSVRAEGEATSPPIAELATTIPSGTQDPAQPPTQPGTPRSKLGTTNGTGAVAPVLDAATSAAGPAPLAEVKSRAFDEGATIPRIRLSDLSPAAGGGRGAVAGSSASDLDAELALLRKPGEESAAARTIIDEPEAKKKPLALILGISGAAALVAILYFALRNPSTPPSPTPVGTTARAPSPAAPPPIPPPAKAPRPAAALPVESPAAAGPKRDDSDPFPESLPAMAPSSGREPAPLEAASKMRASEPRVALAKPPAELETVEPMKTEPKREATPSPRAAKPPRETREPLETVTPREPDPKPEVKPERKKEPPPPPPREEKAEDNAARAKALVEEGTKVLLSSPPQAIGILRRALTLAPKLASVHKQLGIAYNATGNDLATARHLRTYLRLRPGAPDADEIKKMIEDADRASNENR